MYIKHHQRNNRNLRLDLACNKKLVVWQIFIYKPVYFYRHLIVIFVFYSVFLFSRNFESNFRFDANLSEAGIKEAEAGGKALADVGYTFDVAHTSLLTRAHKTLGKCLEAIKQTDLPVNKTWRLNERHYGGI